MNTTFRVAPFSATAWVWTGVFVLGFAFFLFRAISSGVGASFYDVGAAILLGVAIIYGFVRSVRAYTVTGSDIEIVRRGPGRINISRAEVASAEARPDIGSFFNNTMLGTGGLFGWAGNARVRRPTDVKSLQARIYGTNSANSVVLQLQGGRTIVLTPADPQAFVAAVRAPQPTGKGRR